MDGNMHRLKYLLIKLFGIMDKRLILGGIQWKYWHLNIWEVEIIRDMRYRRIIGNIEMFIKDSILCKCGAKMMVDTWIISDAGTNALIVGEMDSTLIQP
jgi:hypothetical protein